MWPPLTTSVRPSSAGDLVNTPRRAASSRLRPAAYWYVARPSRHPSDILFAPQPSLIAAGPFTPTEGMLALAAGTAAVERQLLRHPMVLPRPRAGLLTTRAPRDHETHPQRSRSRPAASGKKPPGQGAGPPRPAPGDSRSPSQRPIPPFGDNVGLRTRLADKRQAAVPACSPRTTGNRPGPLDAGPCAPGPEKRVVPPLRRAAALVRVAGSPLSTEETAESAWRRSYWRWDARVRRYGSSRTCTVPTIAMIRFIELIRHVRDVPAARHLNGPPELVDGHPPGRLPSGHAVHLADPRSG